MSQFIIIDPGLNARIGHNYQMAVGMMDILGKAGMTCRVLSHVDAAKTLEPELARDAIFSQSHYANLSREPYTGQFEDFVAGSRLFTQELARAPGLQIRNDDWIFLPTARPRSLMGLASYLGARKRRPLVAMLFHRTEPPGFSIEPGSLVGGAHRYSANMLRMAIGKNRILWGVTNDYLGQKLGVALDSETTTLPVPVWYPEPCGRDCDGSRAPADAPVIAFVGHMKDGHGFDLIPGVTREIKKRWPRARVRIHVGAIGINKRFDMAGYHELRDAGLAEVIEGWIDDEAMAELYCSATVMVMPYGRDAYREMVSAVLSTAIALGKPSVVPSGTWLADQVDAGRASGVVYQGSEVKDIVHAVEKVLATRGAFHQQAAVLAHPWRQSESGTSLIDALLKWFRQKSKGNNRA